MDRVIPPESRRDERSSSNEKEKKEKMAIKTVGVIRMGTLGTQIAIQAAYHSYRVRGYGQDLHIFQKTVQSTKDMMKLLGAHPTMGADEWEEEAAKVELADDLAEAVKDGDFIIEALSSS